MKNLFLFLVLCLSLNLFSQGLVRIEPENFTSIYGFGSVANFNDSEIAVLGNDGIFPNNIPKIYLFNSTSSTPTPNGSLVCPELNQSFNGGIEMINDYLFVGSINNNTIVNNGGAVYVYKKINGNWQYLLKIQPTVQSENDYFGSKITFYENQLFITASGYDANGNSTVSNGAVYVYYLLQNDNFGFIQTLTGNSSDFGFGDMLDFENNMMVTTSDNSNIDSVYTYKYGNVSWGHVNTFGMPVFTHQNIAVSASNRVSFSNGKLYLYHLLENSQFPFDQKMIKIYNWIEIAEQWSFTENFTFQEGDYMEYKVKVKNNNMYIIPVGFYILQVVRKNPVFHYQFNGTNWNYLQTYTGMGFVEHDVFGYFTVAKAEKALFGNANEKWIIPFSSGYGGAYFLNNTLATDEFENQKIVLFPNPTEGIFSIQSNKSIIKSVELYDTVGKKVEHFKSNFNYVDIKNLNSGIYFCKIIDTENKINYQKIIKN